jgi:hypothetical protein
MRPPVRRERLAHHVGAPRRASRLRVALGGEALERVANGGLGGRFKAGASGAKAPAGAASDTGPKPPLPAKAFMPTPNAPTRKNANTREMPPYFGAP